MSEDLLKLKKDQRKESILKAALKVMSERGIKNTTMREIAKEEHISETLLYRFFKNKYEILFEILHTHMHNTFLGLEELGETIKGLIPDPKITLPLIYKIAIRKLTENYDLLFLLINEQKNFKDYYHEIKEFIEESNEPPIMTLLHERLEKLQAEHLLVDYFKRCQEAGTMKKGLDPKEVAQVFILLINPFRIPHIPQLQFISKAGFDEKEIDEMVQSQINILLYGIL